MLPTDIGVDLVALAAWMDERDLGSGPVQDARLLAGGTQNVLLRFRRGDLDVVLRRGPLHLRRGTNDQLRKEMRVLAALAGTDVPHPRLVAACPDESVLGGAVFYLMEPVDGFNPTVELPAAYDDPAVRHRAGIAAAEALAALGAVDHEAVGLGDVGRPAGFLERQVERWRSQLDGYRELEGYDGPDLPGVDAIAAWLDDNRPEHWTPGILHGDYHLANLMHAPTGGEVAAIVDWEMSTIGDPLLDLGWLVATWPRPGQPGIFEGGIAAAGGLPETHELVRAYGERSTRDLSAVDWYVVLACYKLGIVLEGTYARACAGLAPRDVGERLHTGTLLLLDRAREITGT